MSASNGQAESPVQTTWLTTEQQQAWRTLISLVTRLPAALDTQLQRDSALTHFEYFVLSALSEVPDHKLQLSLLAQQANASLSRLSHVVTKMEKAGWVKREVIRGSRGSNAVLTDAGMSKVVEAAPGHVRLVQALVFEGLDDSQVAQLSALSAAMVDQLDKGIAGGLGKA